jgi:CheY-like chemotaxis protein
MAATILVIEDEDMVREMLKMTLERGGFRVLVARGGNEALDVCESAAGAIDLVLTDIVMPGTSGMDLAGYLAIRYSSSQVDHRKVGKLAMAI